MTASISASTAILKRKYKDGVPKLQFKTAKFMAMAANKTDFTGEDYRVALQTENPQGVGASISVAQASVKQGSYFGFTLKRKSYYGVARCTGEAMKAATLSGGGALVDLWSNEMDGISKEVLRSLEIGALGNGTGIIGQIASGQGTSTVTLTKATDAAKFAFGMRVQVIDNATYSPTIRGTTASAEVVGIDRNAGTITIVGNWSTVMTGAQAGDFIIRNGDAAVGGVNTIPAGVKAWIPGGSTPGTWYGVNRNVDPTRLAGQVYDGTGVALEQGLIDMDSLLSVQGMENELTFWTNPRDIRTIKKSLTGKVLYERSSITSRVAGISFQALQFEGDNGSIKIVSHPYVTEGEGMMLHMPSFALNSAGEAPMILDFDSNNFLRQSNEDAYEVRYGVYGEWGCSNPLANVRAINWGTP